VNAAVNMPNLSALAVRERSLTLFAMLAVALAGLYAFIQLGRAEDPDFTIKTMVVTAAWPGASARDMQEQVADRLEKRLQELEHYDRVDTFARPGFVTLQVNLKDTTPPARVPEQFYQVRKKLEDEARNLPRGVRGPFFDDEFGDVYFALFALKAPGLPERAQVQQAEALRTRLLAVPGVNKVNILGERAPTIEVRLDGARLAALGITTGQVAAALAAHNDVTPAGSIETGGPSLIVRAGEDFASLEAVRATPIVAGGRSLRLDQIASVRRAHADPPSYLIRHQGEPALMLGVVMDRGWNGTMLGRALRAEVAAIRSALPLGLSFEQLSDQSANIAEAYDEFILKFAAALMVVLGVTFAALGWRPGLVVASAVPLTLAAVFVIMLATGRDFDRITLGALILSLGLLVDDAIIAIEMMVVKLEQGLSKAAAAAFAWTATAAPMLSGTLVTVIGFLPIGLAGSSTGEYAGDIFWMLGFALLVSWLVAVLFSPLLGVMLLKAPPPGAHHDPEAAWRRPRFERLRRAVGWVLDRRGAVLAATLAALVAGGAVIGAVVPKQFFPSSPRGEVLVDVTLPRGSSIEATQRVVQRLEAWLLRQPEARQVASFTGAGAPRFFISLNPEPQDPAFAKLLVVTDGASQRDALGDRMRAWVAAGGEPAARVRVSQIVFGPPIPYPVVFRVSGPDLAQVRALADRVGAVMAANPDTLGVHPEWGERAPALRLAYDAERLARLGLTPAEAQRQVAALTSGLVATQAREGNRVADVIVRAGEADAGRPEALAGLTLRTAAGEAVPLANVARLVPVMEEPLLKRRDRVPTIAVRADVRPGVQPNDVSAAIDQRLERLRAGLPPGYAIALGGAAEESGKALGALVPLFPVMLILMLTIIMVQTRSFRLTALVVATAPLGVIGAALALLVTGTPFGFNAILGLIGLAGILMRNTLILTGQIATERAQGRDPRAAVVEATVRRARPVVLTAAAAVLAFLPLTLSTFWGALAVVLIGGTIVGTALTLLVVPALYALVFRLPRRAGVPAEPGAAPALAGAAQPA
jgi:multidrug efflux pump